MVARTVTIDLDSTSDSRDQPVPINAGVRPYYAALVRRAAADPRVVYLFVDSGNVRGTAWIPACVEIEDHEFVVTEQVTHRFGYGSSIAEARQDCIDVLLHYLETLREHEGRMSPLMEGHLADLRQYVDLV